MDACASRGWVSISWPTIEIEPLSGARNPVIIRMVVLLPAPFGPNKPATCPVGSSKETFLTAWSDPNDFEISRTRIMGVS